MSENIFLANWHAKFYRNLRIKLARLKARIYDKVLGIETIETASQQDIEDSFNTGRYSYQPAFYGRLEKMNKYLKLSPEDIFVDLGCGKGRVVCFVAMQKLKKVIGVELDEELYAIAQKNLASLRISRSPMALLNIDVVDFDVKEATVFFMYNPFGPETLEKVLNNIKESLIINPRNIRIVYYCPLHSPLVDKQNWLIRDGKVGNDTCLVWRSGQ